jgi:hypothetical protein
MTLADQSSAPSLGQSTCPGSRNFNKFSFCVFENLNTPQSKCSPTKRCIHLSHFAKGPRIKTRSLYETATKQNFTFLQSNQRDHRDRYRAALTQAEVFRNPHTQGANSLLSVTGPTTAPVPPDLVLLSPCVGVLHGRHAPR